MHFLFRSPEGGVTPVRTGDFSGHPVSVFVSVFLEREMKKEAFSLPHFTICLIK